MNKDTLKDVEKRIEDLQKKRSAEIAAIGKKKAGAEKDLAVARQALADATASTDLAAYEKAEAGEKKAQSALDMYEKRLNQLEHNMPVSDTEAKEVLSSLYRFDKELETECRTAAVEVLKMVEARMGEYLSRIDHARRLHVEWCKMTHASDDLEMVHNPFWISINRIVNKSKGDLFWLEPKS